MGDQSLATNVTPADRPHRKFHDRQRRSFRFRCLNLMDPVAAMLSVGLIEVMVRMRRHWAKDRKSHLGRQLLDMTRIGLLYGLLLEGFKLL